MRQAEYSAKLPNIRLRQAAEEYSAHPYLVAFNHVAVQSYLVRCRALVLPFVLNLVLECSLILTAAEQPPSSSVPEK